MTKDEILAYLRTWQPTSDRVLVLLEEEAQESYGIIRSETKQGEDKRITGIILAVGKGRYGENGVLIPMEFKVNDRVMFGKYAGEDVLVNEDLTIEKYNGVKRDDQIFTTTVRADSLLHILPCKAPETSSLA